MPVGGDELTTILGTYIISGNVANYSALPLASTVNGKFYWVQNSQGTAWAPGPIFGTYYPNGIYRSNGATWEYVSAPNQATQADVDAGNVTDQFVTPATLKNASQWATKENYITPSFTNFYFRGDKTFQPLDTSVVPDSTNRRYLTDSQLMIVAATSGVNTGDETTASIKTKLGIASASQDGYLLQADWNTFNNKQPLITPGTTVQYYRGDKTFQTLDTLAVSENTNLYFTSARVLSTLLAGINTALTGTITSGDSVLTAFGKLQNSISANTTAITTKVTKVASTDNAITRFDGTTGDVQNSITKINDDGSITFTSVASPSYNAWTITPDAANRCFTAYNSDTNVSMQIGKEGWITFYNNSGSTIINGKPVYVSGYDPVNNWLTIALADASDPAKTLSLGLTTESILNNSPGEVVFWGDCHGIDTSAFTAGVTIYLGITPGALTTTAPLAPNYRYRVGKVGKSDVATGWIQVTPSTAALGNGTPGQILRIGAGGSQEFASLKDVSGEYVGLTLFKINFKNVLGTFTSFFTNSNTASRTYAFPDKDITVAGIDDLRYPISVGWTAAATPADSTTYYFGPICGVVPTTVIAGQKRGVIPNKCNVLGFSFTFATTVASSGESNNFTLYNITQVTNVVMTSSLALTSNQNVNLIGFTLAFNAGDIFEIRWTTPAWVTNPTAVQITGNLNCQLTL